MDLPVGIRTLQRTDRWVGEPLCAILTLFRRIFESPGRPGPRKTFTSSYSKIIASFSTRWKLFPMKM